MGDRGVEPNEVIRRLDKFDTKVDEFVRWAQIGLRARRPMAGANLRRQSVDERAIAVGVHHLGDLAELLQPSKDRMAAVANLNQTADIGMHPFGGYPTSRRLIERFSLDKREVG